MGEPTQFARGCLMLAIYQRDNNDRQGGILVPQAELSGRVFLIPVYRLMNLISYIYIYFIQYKRYIL